MISLGALHHYCAYAADIYSNTTGAHWMIGAMLYSTVSMGMMVYIKPTWWLLIGSLVYSVSLTSLSS